MPVHKLLPSAKPYVHLIFWGLALLHLFIPLYNHFQFRTFAYDFAAYNFAFHDYAHLRVSPSPIYHSNIPVAFWQDHFSLLLPMLSPLYWIMAPVTGTYSLLIIQWVFIMAGAIFTFRLISARAGGDLLPLLAVVFYFLLYGRFTAYRSDVNLVTMASGLVPVFLYFFMKRKTVATIGTFVLLLVSREDFSLWLIFVAAFLAIEHRNDRQQRTRALLLGLAALVYFILCLVVFIPSFIETGGMKYSHFEYSALGEGPFAALRYLVHDPVRVVQLLFINHNASGYYDHMKTDFYVCYLLSGMFLLFTRPHYLIPLLPLIAKKMLNDSPVRWGTESYYSVEVVSILPALVFMIIAKWRSQKRRQILAVIVCGFAFGCTLVRFNTDPVVRLLDAQKCNPFTPRFYAPDFDRRELRMVLDMIPPDASVSSSAFLTPQLAFRNDVYVFPRRDERSYVVLLKRGDAFPLTKEEVKVHMAPIVRDPARWKMLYDGRDVQLWKSNPQE